MKKYIYMIQATLSPTDIVYTVYANTEEQMQQEIDGRFYELKKRKDLSHFYKSN